MARRRYRRSWRRMSRRERGALAVAVVVVFMAGAGHAVVAAGHHHHRGAGVTVTTALAPAGAGYTPQTWAQAFIGALGDPETACNVGAVEAWEDAEGGNWTNGAQFNPLDTARTEPGSWPMPGTNPANVQAFPTWRSGMQANLAAITNGAYAPVLAALKTGSNAQAVADAVAASPWGTEPFQAAC